jgi:hypothetical protein
MLCLVSLLLVTADGTRTRSRVSREPSWFHKRCRFSELAERLSAFLKKDSALWNCPHLSKLVVPLHNISHVGTVKC